MIEFLSEPKGSAYQHLVEYAIEKSDAFLLVFRPFNSKGYSKRMRGIRNELARYRLATRTNPEWPGTKIFVPKSASSQNYKIDIYRSTYELIPFLYAPDRLYGWLYPDFPEDLCFFKDGKCWLMTVAHEEMGSIYRHTTADVSFLHENSIDYEILAKSEGEFTEKYRI